MLRYGYYWRMLELAFSRLTRVWLHPGFIYNRSAIKKESDEVIAVTHEFVQEALIDSWKRRKFMKNGHDDFVPVIDRLSAFVEHNPGVINPEDLVNHILTLIPASADTFSIITSFAAMCFGMYPEYQEKAAREIGAIIGDEPRDVTLKDINKMEYLDMCIKDVLRLFPIAPYILRRTLEDYILDKWTIPKSTAIVVPIFNLHRDPYYWENPEHFHPDHFLPEAVQKRHVYAYLPFSAGPRGCIGKIFANILLKVFMANVLQRFEIFAEGKVPDIELSCDISTRPKKGYHCTLQKRQWSTAKSTMK
ncbi:hypothetical protein JTB14_012488 [Gonioctena quinquepunctata]|nr:hypothetical protein JTB14_012488 [Gonioctena quinquepunctata]